MRRTRTALTILSAAAAMLTGTCEGVASDLRDVDWVAVAGRDLNCKERVQLVGTVHHHDLSGDGEAEANGSEG